MLSTAGLYVRPRFFKKLFVCFCLLSIGFCYYSPAFLCARHNDQRQGTLGLINPLLDCMDEENRKMIHPFQDKIDVLVKKLIGNQCSHISVYYRDLNNGPWFGVNQNETFSAGSLLKVPMMIALLNHASDDPSIITKKLKYGLGYNANELQTIRSPIQLTKGESYTVEDLIYYMIVYSDNNALETLWESLPQEIYEKTYADLDLRIIQKRETYKNVSVKEYASFFRILFNASYLGKQMSQKALELLTQTVFKDGLVAGVPPNTVVAHKFGERLLASADGKKMMHPYQLHDCGIIYHPKRPYLLAVMTRGEDMEYLKTVIRDISKLIYGEIDAQTKNR